MQRHWEQVVPYVGHESAIIWPIFRGRDSKADGGWASNVLNGMSSWTLHRMQGRQNGDYHAHPTDEQLYYFLSSAKMKLDGVVIDVMPGDCVHIPPRLKHQLLNDHSDDWACHTLVTAPVGAEGMRALDEQPELWKEQLVRNYREATPQVSHDFALIWTLFRGYDTANTDGPATLLGMTGYTLHRMQPNQKGDYHEHNDREQLYYITEGKGQMQVDGRIIEVKQGDSVYIPRGIKHQLINNCEEWVECVIRCPQPLTPALLERRVPPLPPPLLWGTLYLFVGSSSAVDGLKIYLTGRGGEQASASHRLRQARVSK